MSTCQTLNFSPVGCLQVMIVFFSQKNPSAVRHPEEIKGVEGYEMDLLVSYEHAYLFSPHVQAQCKDARDAIYIRDKDLKLLARCRLFLFIIRLSMKLLCSQFIYYTRVTFQLFVGAPPWSSGSVLDHRSLPPVFESRSGHIWRLFHPWLRFIIFGGRSAHLAYHVHKSGRKTPIIIIIFSYLWYGLESIHLCDYIVIYTYTLIFAKLFKGNYKLIWMIIILL